MSALIGAAVVAGGAFASVATDAYYYNAGDTVQITGGDMLANEAVTVDVTYPDGSLAQEHVVQADASGGFADAYTILGADPGGIYTVTATGQSSGNVYTTTFDPPNPTYDATLTGPLAASPATVQYSDYLTVSGTVTCTDGTTNHCATTAVSVPVELQLKGGPFADYTTVDDTTVSVTYSSGVAQTWSFDWQAGKYASGSVPPGTYDVKVVIQPGTNPINMPGGNDGQHALTITKEATTTTYGGAASGDTNATLNLSATIADADGGTGVGNGVFSPDANLAGTNVVHFSLYEGACPLSGTPTQVGSTVDASIDSSGNTTGTPSLTLPATAGSYCLETGYEGNTYYGDSSDHDTITVSSPAAYTIDGFYQPINNALPNGAKGGSTIPIKFNVLLDGVIQSDTSLVTSLIQKTPCTGGSTVDMLTSVELTTGNTSLRFDSVAQQMVFNWKTPKTTGCYLVTLTVDGGATQSATFELR